MRHRSSPVLLLATLLAGCNVGNLTHLGDTRQTLRAAAPFQRLLVDLPAGSITVREGAGDEIAVSAEVWGPAPANGAAAPAALPFADWLQLAAEGDAVVVRAARPQQDGELRVRIEVPKGERSCDLHLAAGRIDCELAAVAAFAGKVAAGSLRCRFGSVRGACTLEVAAGEVQAEFAAVPATGLDGKVGPGSFRLVLPAKVDAEFELDADVGSIRGAERFGLQVERAITRASARGRAGAGGPKLRVRVATGEIVLG